MAKKQFLVDIDLVLNQLLQARLENLSASPAGSPGRVYFNTADFKAYQYDGTTWKALVYSTDTALTNARTPTSHVLATNAALGGEHTISGAAAGQVLRASSATAANFQKLDHADLNSIGTNNHAAIDTHIADATLHRQINDSAIAATSTYSSTKIEALITTVNSTVAGALTYKGAYDAATNAPLLDATPIAGIKAGWTYVVTVAGTFFSEEVQIGDMVIAKQDTPTTAAHWTVVNKNIPDIVNATETVAGIAEIATTAEVTTGTDDARIVTPLKLKQALGTSATLSNARKYTTTVGDGAALTYVVTHNLNTLNTNASVSRTGTPFDAVECEILDTSVNTTTFNFNVAPTAGQYTVTIMG